MNTRQLAPGWLALVGWLIAWPAAAQAPAAAPARPASVAASAAPAPAAPAASAPATTASAPAAAASAPAAPAGARPAASAPAASAPARAASRPRAGRTPRPAASAARAPAAAAPVAPVPAAPVGPSPAERAGYERDLEAIRNALLESTVAAPVRVQSFGWIDSQGRLHEDTQFTSDARVRGVRVQAYLEDPNAPPPPAPKVKVDLDALPTGVGPRTDASPQRCLDRHARWRQVLHVEVLAAAGPDGRVPADVGRLAAGLQPLLTAAGRQSQRWAMQPRPYQPATAYERVLFGREADGSDWLARVVLTPRGRGWVEAELQLQPQGHAAAVRRLGLPMPPLDAPPAVWAERLVDWVARLDELTACDPLWAAVVPAEGGVRLRQGAIQGLQPGDRLLLVQRQHLGGRLLEPGAVRAMALLQAEDSQGQRLRWLAGPRPGGDAVPGPNGTAARPPMAEDWVVLPL